MKQLTILNTSILTAFGLFAYKAISLEEAKRLIEVRGGEFQSAIGHESTAEILTSILEVKVPMNRIQFEQGDNDLALVFKLNGRAPEGKILTVAEIEAIGYGFGIIEKVG